MMSKYLFYSWLSCLAIYSAQVQKRPSPPSGVYTLDHIQVVDAKGRPVSTEEEAFILTIIKLLPGSKVKIPTNKFESALKALWKHGYAVEINADILEQERLALQLILLKKYPIIDAIHWYGIHPKEIRKLKKALPCSEGKPFLSHLQASLEDYIAAYFCKQGFQNAEADLQIKEDQHDRVTLVIHVKKGKKYRLGRVHFHSPAPCDTYALARLLPYSKKGIVHSHTWYQRAFQYLKRGYYSDLLHIVKLSTPLFNEEKIKKEAQKIADDYRQKGFLDAQVYYELHKKNDKINVIFDIEPGERYTIGKIHWPNELFLSEEAINTGLNLYPGKPYDKREIARLLNPFSQHTNIHSLYAQHGAPVYVSADIKVTGKGDHEVYLQGYVQEQRYPKIKEVAVYTAGSINSQIVKTILAEHDITAGQELRHEKIASCQRALAATGYFHAETIALTPIPISSDEVKIDCHLIESRTIALVGGLEDNKWKISLEEQNFDLAKLLRGEKPTGGGQKLALYSALSEPSSAYLGCSFDHPWMTLQGQRIPVGCQIFRQYKKEQAPSFLLDIHASRPLQRPYPTNYACKLSYRRQGVPTFYPVPFVTTCTLQGDYLQDQTNNPYYPTAGHKSSIRTKATYLTDHSNIWPNAYMQLLGQHQHFYTNEETQHTFCYTVTGGICLNGDETSPLNRLILGESPFAIPKSKLIQPSRLPFRGYQDVSTPNRYAGCSYYGFSQSFELRYRFNKAPLIYGLLFLDTALTDRLFYVTLGAEIRFVTPLCVVSGYIYYPSPQGKLGFSIRFMPNEEV